MLRFTPVTIDRLEQHIRKLTEGKILPHELGQPLDELYWLGWFDGRDSRQAEVDEQRADADRFYARLYNPRPVIPTDFITLADLERRRGNPARAERLEADLRRRFGDAA